ncbi:MAG: NnrU family protein [Gammaproteobacteria bacterium]|nr:MAG: NnrU family protein [Gammaproteobacteria bacterium]
MIALLLACAFFLLIHFGVSGTRLRDALVARFGEGPYRGVFSLASLVGLLWMIRAYSHAPVIELWGKLPRLRPVALTVVFVGVLFVVVGLASANPTSVGMEGRLARGAEGVRGITRITRHPFLWGVSLWALVHITVNGDLASLVLFGSLLLLALAGTTVIDAKLRRRLGERWQAFAASTSNVPFAAIAAGRNRLGPALREIGLVRGAIAIAVYVLIFALHGRVIGVPLT